MKLGTLLRITDISEANAKFSELKNYGFESCQLVYKPETYTEDDALIIKKAAQDNDIEISAQFCGFYDTHTVWDNYYGFQTSGLNIEAYRFDRTEYVKNAATFAFFDFFNSRNALFGVRKDPKPSYRNLTFTPSDAFFESKKV